MTELTTAGSSILAGILKLVISSLVSSIIKNTKLFSNVSNVALNIKGQNSSAASVKIGEFYAPTVVDWSLMSITDSNTAIENLLYSFDLEAKVPFARKWATDKLRAVDTDIKNKNIEGLTDSKSTEGKDTEGKDIKGKATEGKTNSTTDHNTNEFYKQILESLQKIENNLLNLKIKLAYNRQKWFPNMRNTTYEPFYSNIVKETSIVLSRIQFISSLAQDR